MDQSKLSSVSLYRCTQNISGPYAMKFHLIQIKMMHYKINIHRDPNIRGGKTYYDHRKRRRKRSHCGKFNHTDKCLLITRRDGSTGSGHPTTGQRGRCRSRNGCLTHAEAGTFGRLVRGGRPRSHITAAGQDQHSDHQDAHQYYYRHTNQRKYYSGPSGHQGYNCDQQNEEECYNVQIRDQVPQSPDISMPRVTSSPELELCA